MRTLPQIREDLAARVAKLSATFEDPGQDAIQLAVRPQDFLVLTSGDCPPALLTKRAKVLANPLCSCVHVTHSQAEALLVATAGPAAAVVAQTADVVADEPDELP